MADRKNEHGIGILAVMVTVAVLGALAAGLSLYIQNRTKARILNNYYQGRRVALEFIRGAAESPDSLFFSRLGTNPGNQMLRQCLEGGAANDCNATNPAAPVLFVLYTPFSRTNPMVQVTALDPSDPGGHYDHRGSRTRCRPGEFCPFFARSWFWAECPNRAASCSQALKVFVRTQINPIDGALNRVYGSAFKLAAIPTAGDFQGDPLLGVRSVLVSDVMRTPNRCPAGSYMTGHGSSGYIQCVCDQGYVASGILDTATGWPRCIPLDKCPSGEILIGVKADGEPFCFKPPARNYTCKQIATPSTGVANCGNGYRMKGIATGGKDCLVKNNVVYCDDLTITCCRAN